MDPTIIILPELFGLIGFLLWIALTAWERRRRLQVTTDFYQRLLDRLGSLQEFADFVQTPQGEALLKSVTADPAIELAHARVIRAIQIGIVLTSLSAGCFAIGRVLVFDAPESRQVFTALSILALSLGAGSIASGIVAGLMGRGDGPGRNSPSRPA
jgi:hypothetical protein